jgi:hypothetical protein
MDLVDIKLLQCNTQRIVCCINKNYNLFKKYFYTYKLKKMLHIHQ